MCDFMGVFDMVRGMKLWPFDFWSGVRILLTVVGPLTPLILPHVPVVSDIVQRYFG
jgi:hypothetical protein